MPLINCYAEIQKDVAMQISRNEIRLIPTNELPFSRMSEWRMVKDGSFPRPIKIGNRNYWRSDEIQQWIDQKSAQRPAAV